MLATLLMSELEIRHVPVVEDGALVGMLSDRDLARLDIARMLAMSIVNVEPPRRAAACGF
jgi:CBS domain-containing protein